MRLKEVMSPLRSSPIPRLPLCFASRIRILGNKLLLGIQSPLPARILGHVPGRPQERNTILWPVSLTRFYSVNMLLWGWPRASCEIRGSASSLALPTVAPCSYLLGPIEEQG